MKIRTAKDFSRKEIYQIALSYSKGTYTYHNFIEEFGSSQNTFYTIINWAIVKGVVPDDVVTAIDALAVWNSSDKVESISKASCVEDVIARGKRCNKLRRLKRLQYTFPKSEAVKLVKEYISSPLSKHEFCKQNYMTTSVFGRTLKKAIIQHWIGIKEVEKLREKAYKFNNKEFVDAVFNSLFLPN